MIIIYKMENKKEAPNPINQNNEFLTPKPNIQSSEMIKEKNLKIKGLDEQMYNINLKLFEKSISIEASNEKDVAKTKYFISVNITHFNAYTYTNVTMFLKGGLSWVFICFYF